MKRFASIIALLIISLSAFARGGSQPLHINGRVVDAVTRMPLDSVLLMVYTPQGELVTQNYSYDLPKMAELPADPRLVRYNFPVPKPGLYVIRYVKEGYQVYADSVMVPAKGLMREDVPLMKERKLREVTVTATKIKMVQDGDTVIYNADAFELAEGSMLDRLVELLPGVKIHSGGIITVNGEYVSNLLLNGKDFFKGDPSVALRNLPAFTIDRLKVFHQSELCGFNDGGRDPLVMDVRLKREYSQGLIAHADAAGGTDEHYSLRTFAMYLRQQSALSAYANVNNIGQFDEPGKDDATTVDQLATVPTITREGGLNYAYENASVKLSSSLKGGINDSETAIESTMRLIEGDYTTESQSLNLAHSGNLRWNGSAEIHQHYMNLKLHANVRVNRNDNDLVTNRNTTSFDQILNRYDYSANTRRESQFANVGFKLRLPKFSFGWLSMNGSVDYNHNGTKGESEYSLRTDEFLDKVYRHTSEPTKTVNANYQLLYNSSWRNFRYGGNYSICFNRGTHCRNVFDNPAQTYSATTEIISNRLMTYLGYSVYNKFEANLYLAGEEICRNFSDTRAMPPKLHDGNFLWNPSLNISVRNLQVDYTLREELPDCSYLLNYTTDYDPLFIRQGNPTLKNTRQHLFNVNYRMTQSRQSRTLALGGRYELYDRSIIQSRTFDSATGITTLMPVNVSGNSNLQFSGSFSAAFARNDCMNIEASAASNLRNYTVVISAELEKVRTITSSTNIKLSVFHTGIRAWAKVGTEYLSSTFDNSRGWNTYIGVGANCLLPASFNVETVFTYYNTFGRESCVWNVAASWSRKNWTVKLDGHDLLGQIDDFTRTVTAEGTTQSRREVIGRYILLHLQYRFTL